MRVLLIGNYQPLVRALKQGLEEEGLSVDLLRYESDPWSELPTASYDAIVLDLTRPESASLSGLRCWRGAGLRAPVLLLTATSGIDNSTPGFDAALDDWLTKPFELNEFLTRVRAMAQRKTRNVASKNGTTPATGTVVSHRS
jgi:two-component system OmpR family response regulator